MHARDETNEGWYSLSPKMYDNKYIRKFIRIIYRDKGWKIEGLGTQ